jgi:hypothetical protein
VYLSATLGGKSDLQRAYGAKQIELFRAKSAQWGRRYIFVPGLFTSDDEAFKIAANIWDSLSVRRAVHTPTSGQGSPSSLPCSTASLSITLDC